MATRFQKTGQTRKLVIKPFKVKPSLPENFEEDTWSKLQKAIEAVFNREGSNYSEEELYRSVENLCLHKKAETLNTKLKNECAKHVATAVQRLPREVHDPMVFLTAINRLWQEHCQSISTLRNFFLYLDRMNALHSHVKPLWDLGLELFRDNLCEMLGAREHTAEVLLHFIHKERMGDFAPRDLLRNAVQMLVSLGLYDQVLQGRLVLDSTAFYEAEGKAYMGPGPSELNPADYLRHTQRRLREEEARIESYLDRRSRHVLLEVARCQLLRRHTAGLIDRGFIPLLREDRVGDLGLMFEMFSQVNALDELRAAWKDGMRHLGSEILSDAQNQKDWIANLLDFKKKQDRMLKVAFRRLDGFSTALRDAFESFINTNPNEPAQLLAKHVHEQLSTGTKVSEADMDDAIDDSMVLFRFLQAKDLFEGFFRKDLAKRLLLNRSASADAERRILEKLREECGAPFTAKSETMFKDMDLSKSVNDDFLHKKESRELLTELRVDFSCHVLTSGQWPNYPTFEISFPPAAARIQEQFKTFYTARHNGRSLTWITSLGTCTLRANFTAPSVGAGAASAVASSDGEPAGQKEKSESGGRGRERLSAGETSASGRSSEAEGEGGGEKKEREKSGTGGGRHYDLQMSHAQALVLLLFNSVDSLDVSAIREATKLPEGELERTLQSLCLHRVHKPLLKDSAGREVCSTDTFNLNSSFQSKLIRVVLNQIQAKESKEEVEATASRVFEDRQYQVDAAVVRIMKFKKSLSHNALLAELFKQLNFPCRAADVKKRIESLIDREYLERHPEQAGVYNYLA